MKRCNPTPGFCASVIILALAVLCWQVVVGAMAHDKPKAPNPRQYSSPDCNEFIVEYTEEDWDAQLETYPANHAWNDCMGVGRK